MRQSIPFILILFITANLYKLTAQDINFTQYEFAQVFVNPGFTGGFPGTFRIGGVYRDRTPTFPGTFTTPFLAAEMNFRFAFRKKDWTSLAISFIQDRAGDIKLGKGGFSAAGAYHLALGKGNLALGVQLGSVSQNINSPEKGKDYVGISQGGSSSQDLLKLQQGKTDYQDVSAGIVFTTPLKTHVLKLGFAANHITQPNASILSGSNKIEMLLSGSASLQYHLNERTDLIPMFWFRNLNKFSEIVPQCMISYLFNVEKKVRLNAGLGYRIDDALQIMAGIDYGNIRAQLGYDLTTTELSSSVSGTGAIELAVSYIGVITKKPNPKPKVFCPRF